VLRRLGVRRRGAASGDFVGKNRGISRGIKRSALAGVTRCAHSPLKFLITNNQRRHQNDDKIGGVARG